MIDSEHALASVFLWVAGAGFLIVYAVPLFLAPLAWARAFRWNVPAGGDPQAPLTVYFGRCVGGLALAVLYVTFRAAPRPAENRVVFELIGAVGVLMVAVHVRGWLAKAQPWTETIEIPLYVALAVAAFWLGARL